MSIKPGQTSSVDFIWSEIENVGYVSIVVFGSYDERKKESLKR
jgi:hypothetical protein